MLEANEILANKISKLSNLMNKKDEVCLINKLSQSFIFRNQKKKKNLNKKLQN